MICPIQSLFIQGSDKKIIVERFADALLSCPRSFMGKTIQVISTKDVFIIGRKIGADGTRTDYLEQKKTLQSRSALLMQCILSLDTIGISVLISGTIGAFILAKTLLVSSVIAGTLGLVVMNAATVIGLTIKVLCVELNRESKAYHLVINHFLKLERLSKNEKNLVKNLNQIDKNIFKLEEAVALQREKLAFLKKELTKQSSFFKKCFSKLKIWNQNRHEENLKNQQKKLSSQQKKIREEFKRVAKKELRIRENFLIAIHNHRKKVNQGNGETLINFNEISTSLFRAIQGNQKELIGALIKNHPELLEIRNKRGFTPLQQAVHMNSLEVIDILLERGANRNAQDSSGRSVLEMAIAKQNLDVMRRLLKEKNIENKDSKGNTLFFLAIQGGNEKVLELLLQRFPEQLEKKNEGGMTPLLFAAFLGKTAMVGNLFLFNANVHALTTPEKNSLLHMASISRNLETLNLVISLLKQKRAWDIEIKNQDGRTPLHLAVRTGDISIVKELLRLGAKQSSLDHFGKRPIAYKPNIPDSPLKTLLT